MYRKNKRGISPIIATVLLISIALALAAVVFIWAKAFFVEKITKDGTDITMSCDEIRFSASITPTTLSVENQGNIALYGVQVDAVSGGSITEFQTIKPKIVSAGQSVDITLSSGLSSGQSVLIVPIILGQNSKGEKTEYTCDSGATGLQLTVA